MTCSKGVKLLCSISSISFTETTFGSLCGVFGCSRVAAGFFSKIPDEVAHLKKPRSDATFLITLVSANLRSLRVLI